MLVQLAKRASQRNHSYVNLASALQLPLSVVSCFPTPADPCAMGGTVETGGPMAPPAVVAPSASAARMPTKATSPTSRLRLATLVHSPGTRNPERRRDPRSAERDHAADAVLGVHQLEAAVDLVERKGVGDERVDVDVAREIALHELRHLVAALQPAERRDRHAAGRDER